MSLRERAYGRTSQIAALQVRIAASRTERAKDAVETQAAFAAYTEAQQRLDARRALGENEGAEETTTEAQGLHLQFSEQ